MIMITIMTMLRVMVMPVMMIMIMIIIVIMIMIMIIIMIIITKTKTLLTCQIVLAEKWPSTNIEDAYLNKLKHPRIILKNSYLEVAKLNSSIIVWLAASASLIQ